MSNNNLMDVIEGILEEGYNDKINKITADAVKDGKNFGAYATSADTQGILGQTSGQALDAGGDKDVGGSKGDNASDASADTQGVLGKESGQALDAGGDTDVGGSKGDNASDASADTQGVEGKTTGQALDAGGDKDVGKLKEEDEKDEDEDKESCDEEAIEEKDSNMYGDKSSADTQGVLGKKSGQALDAGGDKDEGKLKGAGVSEEALEEDEENASGAVGVTPKHERDPKATAAQPAKPNADAAARRKAIEAHQEKLRQRNEEVETVAEDDVPGSDEATYKPKANTSADAQGVLGKEKGQALDAGGDKDVGKLKEDEDLDEEFDSFVDSLTEAELEYFEAVFEESLEEDFEEGLEEDVEEMDEAESVDDFLKRGGKIQSVERGKMNGHTQQAKDARKAAVHKKIQSAKKREYNQSGKGETRGHVPVKPHGVKEEVMTEDRMAMIKAAAKKVANNNKWKERQANNASFNAAKDKVKGDKLSNQKATKAPKMKQGPAVTAKEDVDVAISEEYKVKAEVIFEAAVAEKTAMIKEEMEANYAKALNEEKEALNEKVGEYVEAAVAEWISENSLEIKYSLRTEIAENFIRGLKGLFEDSYIEIPDADVGVVDELTEAVEEQSEQIKGLSEELSAAKAELLGIKRKEVIATVAEDLTQTQAIRLEKLAEGIEAADIAEFESKMQAIKEDYFDKANDSPLIGTLTEEILETNEGLIEEDSTVNHYAQYLSRTVQK